jgi:hypothetical protein
MPVPGLSAITFSMTAEWWELMPPMAMLHYMLCVI